jgi:hypothetical protein
MKILLWDFNAKVGREYIFKPTIGNESLDEINNDNGIRVVNFAKSKNLIFESTMVPHRNIYKFALTSPDGKTHNQIDHILINRRQHSSVLYIWSFRVADCDTDHYLVVTNFGRDWQWVNKHHADFIWRRSISKKLNEVDGKKQYCVEISNKEVFYNNILIFGIEENKKSYLYSQHSYGHLDGIKFL